MYSRYIYLIIDPLQAATFKEAYTTYDDCLKRFNEIKHDYMSCNCPTRQKIGNRLELISIPLDHKTILSSKEDMELVRE